MADGATRAAPRRLGADFRTFWVGQAISSLGGAVTAFALPLLVFALTGSALNLALTVAANVLPYTLFGLPIGAWADRTDRKRVMIAADLARALAVASVPLAAALGLLSVWWIYAVAAVHSTLTIAFTAGNFAAVPSLVRRDDLVAANGRIQAGSSAATVVGPLLAGLLLVVLPLPALLLVDAASFLASALSLALVRARFDAGPERLLAGGLREAIGEGLRELLAHPVLRWLTLLLLLVNFIAPTAGAQLVLFAARRLGASGGQIGALYAAGGLGVVVFSLASERLRRRWSLAAVALGGLLVEGLCVAALAPARAYPVAMVLWALRGGADALFVIASYSLVQSLVPNHLLGRVITFIRVLTWPTGALGAVLGGVAIERAGVAPVYAAVGLGIAAAALAFAFTPLRRAGRELAGAEPPSADARSAQA